MLRATGTKSCLCRGGMDRAKSSKRHGPEPGVDEPKRRGGSVGSGADIDFADGTESWPTTRNSSLARSGARVEFLPGERVAAERIAQRLFCRRLETWEYAGLAGAPHDAKVEVGASGGKLYIEMGNPATLAYRAYYYVRRTATTIVICIDGFHILFRNLHRRGFGLGAFHRQVTAAAALGVDRIEVIAGRRNNENGYYTWPRYGFDGVLPRRLQRMLPIGLGSARTVLDLMESKNGRTWWREHGVTTHAIFDLVAGSRSHITLEQYVRTKMNSANGPKRNLEIAPPMSYGNAR
jgi:hypothetical protein